MADNPFAKYLDTAEENPFNKYAKTEPKKIGREGFGDALKEVVSEQNPLTTAIAQAGNTAMQYLRGGRQMLGMNDTPEGKNHDMLTKEINSQFPIAGPVGDIGAQIGLTYLGAKTLPLGAMTSKAPALANPYVANSLTGAALGGLKYGDLDQRGSDAALGAAGGAVGTFAGRAIPALWGGAKGLVEPFTEKGQKNIAGRVLRNFAVDPSRVENAGMYASRVPGVNPTLAEAALDPGISNLQRQFAVGTAEQQLANNAARINAMRSAGGTESAISSAKQVLDTASESLYEKAKQAIVQSDEALNGLFKRPSIRQATKGAASNAAERGESLVVKKAEPGQTIWFDPEGNPFAGQVPKPPVEPKFKNVLKDVTDAGGISQQELMEFGLGAKEASKLRPGLFRKEGQTGDALLETLVQKGWINEADLMQAERFSPGGGQELAKDMIRQALNKEPVYHPSDWESAYAFQNSMDEWGKQWGGFTKKVIDPKPAEFSGKTLHDIKLGLDDVLNKQGDKGLQGNAKRAAMGTKEEYLAWLDGKIPEYGQARQEYARLSKPINSMHVGNEILKRSSSAAEDAMGNPTLRNEALSRVLRDGDTLAQSVTGFNKATLRDTLDPVSMQKIADVRKDLARKAAAENLGKAVGSPTAQNLSAQNVLRQIAGPLGAPAGFAEANIWPTLLRPVSWAMKAQDPKIESVLIRAMQDPKFAAELAKNKQAAKAIGSLLGPVENYAIPGISGGLLNERQ